MQIIHPLTKHFILTVFATLLFLLQIVAVKEAKAQYAFLEGCITDAQNDSIQLEWINESGTDWDQISAKLDTKGCFRLRFTPPSNPHRKISFTHAEQTIDLVLQAGDSLQLSVNYWQFDSSISYRGNAAMKNAYLAAENLQLYLPLLEKGGLSSYYQYGIQSMLPEAYLKEMDSLQMVRWQLLENWKNKLHPANYHRFYKQILFETAAQKALYFPLRRFYSRQSPKISQVNEIVGFEDFLFALNWNDSAMHGFLYYNESIRLTSMFLLQRNETYRSSAESKRRLMECQSIDSLSGDESSDYLMADFLSEHIKSSSGNELTEALQYFMQKGKDEALKAQVQALYDEYSLLKPGVAAPAFSLTDAKGRTVKLSDFKGKVVYIDFWASWCTPCLAEFKHLPALKSMLPSDSVVLLYINVDDDKNRWLAASAKHLSTETDLWAGNLFTSEVAQAYQVHGVPKYVLIDKEGRIFNMQAPRPSSPDSVLEQVREAYQAP